LTAKEPQDEKGKRKGKAPRVLRRGRNVLKGTVKEVDYRVKSDPRGRGVIIVRGALGESTTSRVLLRKIEILSVSNKKLSRAVDVLKRDLEAVKKNQFSAAHVPIQSDEGEDEDLSWAVNRAKASASGLLLSQLSKDFVADTPEEFQQRAERGDRDRAEILASSLAKMTSKS
jgi:hypothetical protein